MMLLADFQNTPETGKGNDAEYYTRVIVGDEKGNNKGDNARQQKYWPTLSSEMVFSLDDYGMEYSNTEECGKADNDSDEVHG